MKINGMKASFHHLGIPTVDRRPGERFSERFGMYTSDSDCRTLRIQWHRFESTSRLHPLIRTVPHVAFRVADLDGAIAAAMCCSVRTSQSQISEWPSSRMAGSPSSSWRQR
jgi:hypothetical protein